MPRNETHVRKKSACPISLINLKTVDIASTNGQIEDVLAVNVVQCWIAKTICDVYEYQR